MEAAYRLKGLAKSYKMSTPNPETDNVYLVRAATEPLAKCTTQSPLFIKGFGDGYPPSPVQHLDTSARLPAHDTHGVE